MDWERIFTNDYEGIHNLILIDRFDDAEKEINKILEEDPEDIDALLLKALASVGKGAIGSSIKTLKKAIKIDPKDGRPYFILGVTLTDNLSLKEAIKALKKAVELEPSNMPFHAKLAYAYYEKGRLWKARRIIKEAMEIDPENEIVNSHYALICNIKSDEVIDILMKKDPEDIENLNQLGIAYLREGRYKEAEEAFEKAVCQEPTNSGLQENYNLARKSRLWFYRPRNFLNKLCLKYGNIGMWAQYVLLVILAVLLLSTRGLILLFIIYIRLSDFIGNNIVNKQTLRGEGNERLA